MAADDLLLQGGTRLLHIGPHKTGSTAVQGAFHLARERLAAQGVVYPGRGKQPLWPILAVTGQPALRGEPSPEMAYWDRLVHDIRAAGKQRGSLAGTLRAMERVGISASHHGPRLPASGAVTGTTRSLPVG